MNTTINFINAKSLVVLNSKLKNDLKETRKTLSRERAEHEEYRNRKEQVKNELTSEINQLKEQLNEFASFDVFIHHLDNHPFPFKVLPYEKIIDIKKKVSPSVGIHPNDIQLMYNSRICYDELTINDYGIHKGSSLLVIRKLSG